MPATFNSVQTRVTNLVGSSPQISSTQIQQIIQAEHDTILNDNSWAERKAESTLATVAPYTTGTLSTSGTTVTGVGTTWTSAMVGRYLKVGTYTEYFLITAFTSATSLTIERAVPQGDIAAGSTYEIFQNVYTLPSDCERITSMVYQTPIHDTTRQDLDRIDPYRTYRSSIPTHRIFRELSSTGLRQIELWPVPSAAVLIRFQYLKKNDTPTTGSSWSADTTYPLYRADILVWKSGETAAYFLFSKTGDQSWAVLAERYHNNYNESLSGARLDDLAKNSSASKIRDVLYSGLPYYGPGSDFSLDHDPAFVP